MGHAVEGLPIALAHGGGELSLQACCACCILLSHTVSLPDYGFPRSFRKERRSASILC